MFQILAPKLRLDVPPDVQRFAKEIDRAYPEVRRVVDELYAELAEANAATDAAFEKDLVWPPGSFWERRETESALATIPRIDGSRADARLSPLWPSSRATTTTAPSWKSQRALRAMLPSSRSSPWPACTGRGRAGSRGWTEARMRSSTSCSSDSGLTGARRA